VVWPALRGLDVVDYVPSSENSSSSSEGITSGPFAPAAAFAVARRGGFVQCLAPSRFKETRGTLTPAVFWRFAAAGPPSAAGLPSAIAPAVLPTPFSRWGQTLELLWGPFWFELDLACLGASGRNNDVPRRSFSWFLEKGARAGFVLYQLPRGILKFYLPKRLFSSFEVRGKFCFFPVQNWESTILGNLRYSSCSCSTLRLSEIASCASYAVMP
jgi:hypothetical protein